MAGGFEETSQVTRDTPSMFPRLTLVNIMSWFLKHNRAPIALNTKEMYQ
jgi:hypothetical protein